MTFFGWLQIPGTTFALISCNIPCMILNHSLVGSVYWACVRNGKITSRLAGATGLNCPCHLAAEPVDIGVQLFPIRAMGTALGRIVITIIGLTWRWMEIKDYINVGGEVKGIRTWNRNPKPIGRHIRDIAGIHIVQFIKQCPIGKRADSVKAKNAVSSYGHICDD